MKRTLVIKNREIVRPSSVELRKILRAFKKDPNNVKLEDEFLDFMDILAEDNLIMMEYIVGINRMFENITIK